MQGNSAARRITPHEEDHGEPAARAKGELAKQAWLALGSRRGLAVPYSSLVPK
jgi:hypothetical protein